MILARATETQPTSTLKEQISLNYMSMPFNSKTMLE